MSQSSFRIRIGLVGLVLLTVLGLLVFPLLIERYFEVSRYKCFVRLSSREASASSFRRHFGLPVATDVSWRGEYCSHYDLTRHATGSVCVTPEGLLSRTHVTVSDPAYGPLKAIASMYAAFFRHMAADAELSQCLEQELE